jgi:hypothetical protein
MRLDVVAELGYFEECGVEVAVAVDFKAVAAQNPAPRTVDTGFSGVGRQRLGGVRAIRGLY